MMGAPTNGGAVVDVLPPSPDVVVVVERFDFRFDEPGAVVDVVPTVVDVVPTIVDVVVDVTAVVVVDGVVVEVVGDDTLHVGDEIVLSSSVTAPFRARARP